MPSGLIFEPPRVPTAPDIRLEFLRLEFLLPMVSDLFHQQNSLPLPSMPDAGITVLNRIIVVSLSKTVILVSITLLASATGRTAIIPYAESWKIW